MQNQARNTTEMNTTRISLRDILFLTHAKPQDLTATGAKKKFTKDERQKGIRRKLTAQEKLWKSLVEGTLEVPDTWETQLSAGADKKETFTRLLKENKLGALALIRNLRNMTKSGVDKDIIKSGIKTMKVERVLPFRFITAAKYAPQFEKELEDAMFRCLDGVEKLQGKTVLMIDVSGSMNGGIGGKSELSRIDAAAALAILAREMCEDVVIYCTAGNDGCKVHATEVIPSRRGFALAEAVRNSANRLGGGGIFLQQCLDYAYEHEKRADRIIVFTDEQDCSGYDAKLAPDKAKAFGDTGNYIVNVSSSANGIGYKKFTHVNGFSEATLQFISALESESSQQ
jgi:hypothetical protein